jgi:Family of unknown function (DUF6496)
VAKVKFRSTGFSAATPVQDMRYRDYKFPKEKKPVASKKMKKAKMQKVMGEFKKGELHSGSKQGPPVTNRKQAVAIGLSQIRKAMGKKQSGNVY